jgi:amino acid adenylation domain-containing protein
MDNDNDPPRGGIHELFTAQAIRTPDAIAVVCGNARQSYADIERRSNQLAHALRRRGVRPEVGVGVCMERSIDTVMVFLAVLKAGGTFVPFDPEYPPQRLAYMTSQARIALVITTSEVADRVAFGSVPQLVLNGDEGEIARQQTDRPESLTTLDNLACMLFTSGSTGTPKCVMATHANYWNYFQFWRVTYLDDTPMRCHLQMASFAFVIFVADVTRALFTGATLVICPKPVLMWPADLYELMVRERVNSAEFVTPVLTMLVEHLEETGQTLEFLDLLVAGGDVWFTHDYERALRLCSPSTKVIAAYGMTETAIDNATVPPGALPVDVGGIVPAGRPTLNTELYVLDERLRPVLPGAEGELYIGGLGVARGYLGRPAHTAERFVPDPFGPRPGARLYRTGDLCRRRLDGMVEILGRVDNQVKLNGIRVELGEIEATLLSHPLVDQAVVVVRGQAVEGRSLVGYVVMRCVPANTMKSALEGVRTFLRVRLPTPLVPAILVPVDDLPLNANGKVDRRELAARSPVVS